MKPTYETAPVAVIGIMLSTNMRPILGEVGHHRYAFYQYSIPSGLWQVGYYIYGLNPKDSNIGSNIAPQPRLNLKDSYIGIAA